MYIYVIYKYFAGYEDALFGWWFEANEKNFFF